MDVRNLEILTDQLRENDRSREVLHHMLNGLKTRVAIAHLAGVLIEVDLDLVRPALEKELERFSSERLALVDQIRAL